jgi:teichoic acid transport system ATP-binding protein
MSTGNGLEPTVIVDDLHVVYRVYGAGGDKGTAATALMRLVKHQRRPSVREVHAIRGVSFVVNHGEAIGIIGRNGSGKSTLLQAIAGLLPPEQGCVYTSGQAALLGVNAALLDDLTGERNVVLGCLAMGMTPQEVKDRYESIVDFSGVGGFIDYPMRTYSTGMAQRLRFSIAAAKTHEILMIDEALATGDANFRAKSHEKIMELRGEAGTVFLVAHNLGEIEASCNRVIWLEKGQIVMQGYDVPAIVDAYLEATGGEPRRRDLPQEADHTAGLSAFRGPQPQAHGRAAGRARAGRDLAVLGLGQTADDEQADANPAEPATVAGLALVKPVEDALVIRGRDADALVFHRHLDPGPGQPGPHGDGAAGR